MSENALDLRGLPEIIRVLEVSAVMLFPADEQERNHWMLRALLAHAARVYGCMSEQFSFIEHQSAGAQIGKDLGANIARYGGWSALADITAGRFIKHKPFLEQTGEKRKVGIQTGATLFQAIETRRGVGQSNKGRKEGHEPAAAQTIEQDVIDAGGRFPHSSRNFTNRTDKWYSWTKYKSVAHFWSAYIYSSRLEKKKLGYPGLQLETFQGPNLPGLENSPDLPAFPKGLQGFVEYANYFLESASQANPRAGKQEPLLREDEAWKILL